MKRHLEDLLDNSLEMYDKEVLKNIQLKKQYEIMKMNAEYLIEKNDELNKKIKEQNEEIERLHTIIKEVREFVESMEYCGQEDYFYDKKANDPCGNDNTFNDSKYKLLEILDKVGSDKE